MSQEKDKVFFRNFSLIVGALVVMMIIFIIAARIVGINEAADAERSAASVAKITAPMGEVSIAGEEDKSMMAAETATEVAEAGTSVDGKAVYEGLCTACHGVPGIGAPVLGNAEEWAPRIEKGIDTLYNSAINGFTGEQGFMMPAKGGNPALSDEEIKAAVDYMVSNSQ